MEDHFSLLCVCVCVRGRGCSGVGVGVVALTKLQNAPFFIHENSRLARIKGVACGLTLACINPGDENGLH